MNQSPPTGAASGPAAAAPAPLAEGPVASPCINICQLEPATGWCTGCLRSLEEIASWSALSDAQRRRVLEAVAQRRRDRNPP